jgi:hypothetical protein
MIVQKANSLYDCQFTIWPKHKIYYQVSASYFNLFMKANATWFYLRLCYAGRLAPGRPDPGRLRMQDAAPAIRSTRPIRKQLVLLCRCPSLRNRTESTQVSLAVARPRRTLFPFAPRPPPRSTPVLMSHLLCNIQITFATSRWYTCNIHLKQLKHSLAAYIWKQLTHLDIHLKNTRIVIAKSRSTFTIRTRR